DVVVVGGGVSGVAAAIAAARDGASVCLLEREYSLGGLATLGLVWCYLPLCDGNGHQIMGSLAERFLKRSIQYGPGEIPVCWRTECVIGKRDTIRYELEFNPASFAISLDEEILQYDIQVLFGSLFCDVIKEDGNITAVIVETKSGRNAIKSSIVIDATGDADVCLHSGEETFSTKSNRLACWCGYINNGLYSRKEMQVPLFGSFPEGARPYDGVDVKDITEFMLDGRKLMIDYLLKESKDSYPIILPSIPQLRLSRHFVGNYELKANDQGIWFNDSVGLISDWLQSGIIYSLPFRSLRAVNTNNLLVAGRCISAESEVGDVIRSIPACVVSGEAVGTAAALSIKTKTMIPQLSIKSLQVQLERHGVINDKQFLSEKEVSYGR
ncbi:MAG: FAD-dependent oxidoreductase, partial [Sphaerochaetaceae bacterium]|nr:FAD-dependent oxidoreductase [Sphaerochaetaceae bacterium]